MDERVSDEWIEEEAASWDRGARGPGGSPYYSTMASSLRELLSLRREVEFWKSAAEAQRMKNCGDCTRIADNKDAADLEATRKALATVMEELVVYKDREARGESRTCPDCIGEGGYKEDDPCAGPQWHDCYLCDGTGMVTLLRKPKEGE